MINKDRLALGIAALRSGIYIQGQGALKMKENDVIKHCCLGVLTEEAIANGCEDIRPGEDGVTFEELVPLEDEDDMAWEEVSNGDLPANVRSWYGFSKGNPSLFHGDPPLKTTAIELNDAEGNPFGFAYIADAFQQTYIDGDGQETGS